MGIVWQTINTPRFWMKELYARNLKQLPNIADPLTTLQIVNEGASLVRFGDCEFNYIMGGAIPQQLPDSKLKARLADILMGKDSNPGLRVGIPYVISSLDGFTRESKKFWVQYLACNRAKIYQIINFEIDYLDAQITRFWINRNNPGYSNQLFDRWKLIWDNKKVLLVEGEYSRFGAGNDLFNNARVVKRILCPSQNAFFLYDKIKQETLRYAADYDVVLLVLGPTATVLGCDLAKEGLWVIDSGNLDMEYEWFKLKTKKKVKISNKTSIEMPGGTEVSSFKDRHYQEQIIAKVC